VLVRAVSFIYVWLMRRAKYFVADRYNIGLSRGFFSLQSISIARLPSVGRCWLNGTLTRYVSTRHLPLAIWLFNERRVRLAQ